VRLETPARSRGEIVRRSPAQCCNDDRAPFAQARSSHQYRSRSLNGETSLRKRHAEASHREIDRCERPVRCQRDPRRTDRTADSSPMSSTHASTSAN
jgi:hypothetical protein